MSYFLQMQKRLTLWDVRHFTAFELCPVGRIHNNVTLMAPPKWMYDAMLPTIVRIETVRRATKSRLRIMSGYRQKAYNDAVGGSSRSMHLVFNALDIVPLDVRLEDFYEEVMKLPGIHEWGGVGLYRERGFLHFDTRGLLNAGDSPWHEIV
jgi:uncharacterized protein YcbK (DUF882 family)